MITESIIVLGTLGLGFGVGLAYLSKKFEVKVDPRVGKVRELLPGANCGACGYAGCDAFADAVVNEDADFINKTMKSCNLDIVQLSGDESNDLIEKIKFPVWKVIHVDSTNLTVEEAAKSALERIKRYESVDRFLLDTYKSGQYGGTGKSFDPQVALMVSNYHPSIIISGGINIENIGIIKNVVNPSCLDLSSGVESSPGKKDHEKLKKLFNLKL